MTVSKQNVVDIIQWVLIIGLSAMLLYSYLHTNSSLVNNEEYSRDNTYVRIYESQKIEKLYTNMQKKDSIYDFRSDNDTVNYNLKVKAADLQWYTMDFSINDKFTVVNQNEDALNKTTISHSDNVSIEKTTVYHSRDNTNKLYNRFAVGPTIGVGVSQNGQFCTYIGVGVTFSLFSK